MHPEEPVRALSYRVRDVAHLRRALVLVQHPRREKRGERERARAREQHERHREGDAEADEERRAENRRRDRRRVGLVRPEQVPLEQEREALDVRAERLLRARAGPSAGTDTERAQERGAGHARHRVRRVLPRVVLRAVPRGVSPLHVQQGNAGLAAGRAALAAADVPHQTASSSRAGRAEVWRGRWTIREGTGEELFRRRLSSVLVCATETPRCVWLMRAATPSSGVRPPIRAPTSSLLGLSGTRRVARATSQSASRLQGAYRPRRVRRSLRGGALAPRHSSRDPGVAVLHPLDVGCSARARGRTRTATRL